MPRLDLGDVGWLTRKSTISACCAPAAGTRGLRDTAVPDAQYRVVPIRHERVVEVVRRILIHLPSRRCRSLRPSPCRTASRSSAVAAPSRVGRPRTSSNARSDRGSGTSGSPVAVHILRRVLPTRRPIPVVRPGVIAGGQSILPSDTLPPVRVRTLQDVGHRCPPAVLRRVFSVVRQQ